MRVHALLGIRLQPHPSRFTRIESCGLINHLTLPPAWGAPTSTVQRAFSQRKYMNISEERKRELRRVRDPKKPLFLVGEHKSKYIPKPPKPPYGDAFNENYLKQKHMDVRPKQKTVTRFRATVPITVLQCTRMGHVNSTCPYFEETGIYSIHEAEESAQSISWPYRHSPQPYFNKQGTQGIFFNWNSN